MKIEIKESKFYVNLPVKLYEKIKEISDLYQDMDIAMLGLLLHFILSSKYKDKNLENGSKWVVLNAEILRRYDYCEYKTKEHLEVLLEHEVLEKLEYNADKGISRQYRICPSFFKKETLTPEEKSFYDKSYDFSSPKLVQKISKHLAKRRVEADYKCEHLTKWLSISGFEMDTDKAIDYVNKKYSKNDDKFKREKRIQAIHLFPSHQKAYSRDGKDDRLHSYFTILPSDLKQFVTYKGERLKEADVKSSQPFILSFILDIIQQEYSIEMDKNDSISFRRFSNRLYKRFNSLINQYEEEEYKLDIRTICDNITIMLQKASEDVDFIEINRFISLIRSDDIYEYVGESLFELNIIRLIEGKYVVELFDKESNRIRPFEFENLRKCGKQITINAIYSSPKKSGVQAIEQFKLLFPEVAQYLKVLKGKYKADLPILMQRIESKCILDHCSKRIAKKHSKMLLISRHDSLVTTQKNYKIMKQEFQLLLNNYFMLKVDLGEELWDSNFNQ